MKKYLVSLVILSLVFSFASISFAQDYNEAPMLAELVEQGKLPPVEERLPEEPLVYMDGTEVPDFELEVGKYGGTLRLVGFGSPLTPELSTFQREPLLRTPGLGTIGKKPEDNVFKSFDMSEDAKVFTFYMREGLKWSDGHPVTTEDVRFAYEDVLLNEELTPVFPRWLRTTDGSPCELEILDEYTFRITFKESYALFPYVLSLQWNSWDYGPLLQPSHYMKKFHIKYTPLEELKPLLAEEKLGEKEWYRLYQLYSWSAGQLTERTIECPTISPWVLVEMPNPQVAVLERNPYYWKVDKAGNQLPYIDRVRGEAIASVDLVPMEVIGGRAHYTMRGDPQAIPFYKENEEKGGYRTIIAPLHAYIALCFNYSNPDLAWREIIWNPQFRRALTLAINKEEINDSVYLGLGSLPTIIPSEYDPAEANRILDEMGLDKRDTGGWRLRPDGKRMELFIETSTLNRDFIDVCEIVTANWMEIGLYTTWKQIDSSLLSARVQANETQIVAPGWLDIPVILANPYMMEWVLLADANKVSQGFCDWYISGGKEGIEPPPDIRRVFELYNEMRTSSSFLEIGQYLDQWKKAMYDSILLIVPVEDTPRPVLVSNKLGNFPEEGYETVLRWGGEVLFFKE